MDYSMVLENNVILSGLSDNIILNCKSSYIKKIYKTIVSNKLQKDIILYDVDLSGSVLCDENFTDNDLKIVYKFDINTINKFVTI